MSNITDQEFKKETVSRLSALEEQTKRIPQIENRLGHLEKDVSEILGILKGRESMISRNRANIALWIAAGVALFGEAGSKLLDLFR